MGEVVLYTIPYGNISESDHTYNVETEKSIPGGAAIWYEVYAFLLDYLEFTDSGIRYGKIQKILAGQTSSYTLLGHWTDVTKITFRSSGYVQNNVVVYRDGNNYSFESTSRVTIHNKVYNVGDIFTEPLPYTSTSAYHYTYMTNSMPIERLTQRIKEKIKSEWGKDVLLFPDASVYDGSYGLNVAQGIVSKVLMAEPNQYTTYYSISKPQPPQPEPEPSNNNTYIIPPQYINNPSNKPGFTPGNDEPSRDPGDNNTGTGADDNNPEITGGNVFQKNVSTGTVAVFCTDASGLRAFWDFFWGIPDIQSVLLNSLSGMFNSLSDQVMSIQMMPFTAADLNITTVTQAPVIGRYVMEYNLPRVTDTWNEIDMGEIVIKPQSGDEIFFYDLKPYTTLHLSLPFMSTSIELDTNIWMGKKLVIKLSVDILTGKGLYKLKDGGGNVLQYLECNVCTDIPYCLDDSIGNATKIAETTANDVASLTLSKGIPSIQGVDFSPLKVVDSSSQATSHFGRYKAQLLIQRPIRNESQYFGSTIGYACEITKKLSDCNGLVIIDNPIVQQTAQMLDDDYMEIKNLMSGGIRV